MGISLNDVQRGYERWAAKPHNAKWVRKIDGTPIANDIVVNIFEALKDRPPETAVKVRELEWQSDFAHTPFGLFYMISDYNGGAVLEKIEGSSTTKSAWPSRQVAKDAAQGDYERRILSALVPADALKELGKGDGR